MLVRRIFSAAARLPFLIATAVACFSCAVSPGAEPGTSGDVRPLEARVEAAVPNAFRFERDAEGVGVITFDAPDMWANVLSQAHVRELLQLLESLRSRHDLSGLIFQSGKADMFIVGADLGELQEPCADAAACSDDLGARMIDAFGELPFPTVAAIDGPCLGGGLELTLGLDARVASNAPSTILGSPEVKVGLIPGWGGTQRLPRLIGLEPALDLVSRGDVIDAEGARSLGLVTSVVALDALRSEAKRALSELPRGERLRQTRRLRRAPLLLPPRTKAQIVGAARRRIWDESAGQLPAPLAVVDVMGMGVGVPLAQGLALESRAFLQLVGSPISRALLTAFALGQQFADP